MKKVESNLHLNQKGLATIETLPLLVIFLILIGYALGFFGAIHTGILHSIASRTYAFETFRHRPNLNYFRDNRGGGGDSNSYTIYTKTEVRYHVVKSETSTTFDKLKPSERPITFGLGETEEKGRTADFHSSNVLSFDPGTRYDSGTANEGVNPIWIKVAYGICVTAGCSGGN